MPCGGSSIRATQGRVAVMGESRSLGRPVTGLLLVTLALVSCGTAEEVTREGDPQSEVDEAVSEQQNPLRRRWRPWRRNVWTDAGVAGSGDATGPGDSVGSGGSVGT